MGNGPPAKACENASRLGVVSFACECKSLGSALDRHPRLHARASRPSSDTITVCRQLLRQSCLTRVLSIEHLSLTIGMHHLMCGHLASCCVHHRYLLEHRTNIATYNSPLFGESQSLATGEFAAPVPGIASSMWGRSSSSRT